MYNLESPSYVAALQEVLLALAGYSGDVFVRLQASQDQLLAPDDCNFEVAPSVNWIDDADRNALGDIIKLGFHCDQLRWFVENEHSQGFDSGSAYRKALCAGLSEFLDVYMAVIVMLQDEVLTKPRPVLADLYYHLNDMQVLLPQLHQLVYELHQGGEGLFTGGRHIMHMLATRCNCGLPPLQAVAQRLMWHCNQVLFRQLSGWMVHGLLLDPHHDFFIQASAEVVPGVGEDVLRGVDGGIGVGDQTHDAGSLSQEWHYGFQINEQLLPPHVSVDSARHVLFIGKAVRVLQRPQGVLRGAALLPASDSLATADTLRQLQALSTFDAAAFEHALEELRARVASRLWELLVVRAELLAHLQALKEYALLARGDLWQTFLADTEQLMASPVRPASVDGDLAIALGGAAAKTTAQHDRLLQLFSLHLHNGPVQVQVKDRKMQAPKWDGVWDGLSLQYQVEWPLGLLLKQGQLARYNLLFGHLLRLKRVQMRLDDTWRVLCRRLGASQLAEGRALQGLLQLRQQMSHFITNLQIYIQVDVIESNFALLSTKVAAARDFAELEHAHKQFVDALISQSFLHHTTLCNQIAAVFEDVRALCMEAEHLAEGAPMPPEDKVQAMADKYQRCIAAMYTALQNPRLQEVHRAPHLQQFYLRLDFNGFASRSGIRSLVDR